MSKRPDNRKWHQQKRWILGSLLLFPPLGIPLLWLTRWPRAGKIGGSILSGMLLLSVLTGKSSEPTVVSAEPPMLEAAEPVKAEPVVSAAYKDAIAEATAATEDLDAAESPADWERIASQWQAALSSLGDIPVGSDDYSQAQVKIAEYERNYDYAISQKAAIEVAVARAEAEALAQRRAEEQAAEAEAQRQAEEQAIAQQQAAAQVVEAQGSYVSGTCKDLRASGVGSDFRPGDANYTSARDRDNDGIACES